MYKSICLFFASLILLFAICVGATCDDKLDTLTNQGITVSYPASLKPQAERVLDIFKGSVVSSLAIHRDILSLLDDPQTLADNIALLCGAEEKSDETMARLMAYKIKSQALLRSFTNVRLIESTKAASLGTVDAGVMQVNYIPEKNEFKMTFGIEGATETTINRSYFPVIVNADGTIRSENKISDMAISFLGSSKAMVVAPIHDCAGYIIAQELGLYHPFTRWFNEGVSAWVTRHILAKIKPGFSSIANELFSISSKSKQLKPKVNFLTWVQPAYQFRGDNFDQELEAAHVQYAIEAVSGLLQSNGAKELPKIMAELKYAGSDNEAICNTIKKVTNRDFKPYLLSYVPDDIKDGIAAKEPEKLAKKAEQLVREKKWNEAAEATRRILEMAPADVNARLNLAWLLRETEDTRHESEMQVFLAARLLDKGQYSFKLYAGTIEGNYILGRLAILLGNFEYARKFIEPVLALDPNHNDARRAMAEIKKTEEKLGIKPAENPEPPPTAPPVQ